MAVFFAGPLIIIVLLIVLLSAALFVVPQQQAYIIERFGKFLKVQFAGIHPHSVCGPHRHENEHACQPA